MKRLLTILLLLPCLVRGNITFVSSTAAGGGLNPTSVNVTVNTTSAQFIVVAVKDFQGVTAGTVSDNQGNTYTLDTSVNDGATTRLRIYHAYVTTADASTVITYSTGANVSFCTISASLFNGVAASNPVDVKAGTGASSGTSGTAGSITPSVPGCLIFNSAVIQGAAAQSAAPTLQTPTSFTRINPITFANNSHFASADAYWIQNSATATNQQWNWAVTFRNTIVQVAIKPASYTPPPSQSGGIMLWWYGLKMKNHENTIDIRRWYT